jgi:apolipoprotein N-acyltransferase
MVMANPQTPARPHDRTIPGPGSSAPDPQPSTTDPRPSMSHPRSQSGSESGVWKRKWVPQLIPALMTASLLWACFFPLAQGWCAWFALVPLLSLARSQARPRYVYWSAFAGGLAFFWPVLQWLRVGDYNMMYYSWMALATYCAVYFPLAVFLTRQIDARAPLPLPLVFPAVWTGLEFLRSYVLTGFPWYYLAHTQHDYLSIIQISDLGGAYAVSFLVAAVNAMIFEWQQGFRWFRVFFSLPERLQVRWWALTSQTAGVLLVLGAALLYGNWRLGQNSFDAGPRVALIQGNLDQDIRNEASLSEQSALESFQHFRRICDLAAVQRPTPNLIVWPENSCPESWLESPSGHPDSSSLKFARQAGQIWKTNLLLGMEAYVPGPDEEELRFNSAVLVLVGNGRGGITGEPGGRYDKIHCVPFGEYVPFQDAMPWMKTFAPYDFDYSIRSGKQQTRFQLDSFRFGVLICFEDTDPVLARNYVAERAADSTADFFINISNDGWWRGTSGHDEHLAISRFRAIENRRAVCRSVNMGISAVIDGNGRVLEPRTIQTIDNMKVWEISMDDKPAPALPVSRWSDFKQVQGVLLAAVPIDHRGSFYARWGDWFPWTCWLVVAIGLGWSLIGRLAGKRSHVAPAHRL